MPLIHLNDIEEKELVPGYHVRFVHTDNMTVAYWNIDAGAALPVHNHVHEQVVNIIEGTFQLTVDGEALMIEPGAVVTIAPDVPHSGKAITNCRIIDVFHPVREDYR
ncbi:MAG: cupin domain-containing protein [Planctomycetota bacterium]|jgi:quercetin dioxygenase-like cupin family protein